jgi:hypothetical protein
MHKNCLLSTTARGSEQNDVVDALRVLVLAYDTTVSLAAIEGAWGHETAARTFELEGEVVRQVFPRKRKMLVGYHIFRAQRYRTH